jgi:hypothetical protein
MGGRTDIRVAGAQPSSQQRLRTSDGIERIDAPCQCHSPDAQKTQAIKRLSALSVPGYWINDFSESHLDFDTQFRSTRRESDEEYMMYDIHDKLIIPSFILGMRNVHII